MTDPHKGIERDRPLDDDSATDPNIAPLDPLDPTEAAATEAAPTPPVDLGATVTLSPEALAALLEEVKKGKR